MKLDKNKYAFKVMEGMVKHTRGDVVNPSLPYVRSCASSKPCLYNGLNRETCMYWAVSCDVRCVSVHSPTLSLT